MTPVENGTRKYRGQDHLDPSSDPDNRVPFPYASRIANEPSTRPITDHCGTSKTPSPATVPSILSFDPFYSPDLRSRFSRNILDNGNAAGWLARL